MKFYNPKIVPLPKDGRFLALIEIYKNYIRLHEVYVGSEDSICMCVGRIQGFSRTQWFKNEQILGWRPLPSELEVIADNNLEENSFL